MQRERNKSVHECLVYYYGAKETHKPILTQVSFHAMMQVDDENEEEESDMNELYVKNANEGNMYAIYNTL